ncbi:autotransporter-associated beta strand repeat-containing protein, partial [bacterium]|nr:autotransporter-associated beta strand repeat-containing protein [bacterium]
VGTLGNGGLEQSAASGLLKFTSDLTATGLGNKTFILQGSSAGTGEFAGKIVDSTGFATSLAKYGTGTWTLSGANTYTGATNVAAGTLALAATGSIDTSPGVTIGAGATLDTTAQASFALPGAKVYTFAVDSASTGSAGQIKAADLNIATANTALSLVNPTLDDAVYVIATYTGTLTGTFATAAPAGYSWNYGTGTNSQITLVQDVAGYASWNTSNAGGQDPSLDWDNDGVSNGVEFFMNAPAGFTNNPAMGPGNTISWTNGGNIPSSAYGTQYIVQTSSDLVTWADVLVENLTANTNSLLTYTLTGSGPRFVRLKVTPN